MMPCPGGDVFARCVPIHTCLAASLLTSLADNALEPYVWKDPTQSFGGDSLLDVSRILGTDEYSLAVLAEQVPWAIGCMLPAPAMPV